MLRFKSRAQSWTNKPHLVELGTFLSQNNCEPRRETTGVSRRVYMSSLTTWQVRATNRVANVIGRADPCIACRGGQTSIADEHAD